MELNCAGTDCAADELGAGTTLALPEGGLCEGISSDAEGDDATECSGVVGGGDGATIVSGGTTEALEACDGGCGGYTKAEESCCGGYTTTCEDATGVPGVDTGNGGV